MRSMYGKGGGYGSGLDYGKGYGKGYQDYDFGGYGKGGGKGYGYQDYDYGYDKGMGKSMSGGKGYGYGLDKGYGKEKGGFAKGGKKGDYNYNNVGSSRANPAWRTGGSDYDDRQSKTPQDSLREVASKLGELRDSLDDEPAKVYHALQLSLAPHTRANSARPQFSRDFREHLGMLFPNATSVKVKQSLSAVNQWQVTIDDGPEIFCSVRLEDTSGNPNIMKELRDQIRVVKDTLLSQDGYWKKQLETSQIVDSRQMTEFQQQCRRRALEVERDPNRAGRFGGGKGGSDGFMDDSYGEDDVCHICKQSKGTNLLGGEHMCVVVATFECESCGGTWTSYNARLRQDGEAFMGQRCQRCELSGSVTDWRPKTAEEQQERGMSETGSIKGTRMHMSELCDACKEFGNCTGVFHDPFVVTVALSLLSKSEVKWHGFSEGFPELLVADVESSGTLANAQFYLQPHVYVRKDPDRGKGGRLPQHLRPQVAPSVTNDRTVVSSFAAHPAPATQDDGASGVRDPEALQRFLSKTQAPAAPPASTVRNASAVECKTNDGGEVAASASSVVGAERSSNNIAQNLAGAFEAVSGDRKNVNENLGKELDEPVDTRQPARSIAKQGDGISTTHDKKPAVQYFTATNNFDATQYGPEYLSFNQNDIIGYEGVEEAGWRFGFNMTKDVQKGDNVFKGWFPPAFVKEA